MGTNMGIEKPVSLSTQAFEVYLVHLHRGKFSLRDIMKRLILILTPAQKLQSAIALY
jgi:hypothetical protein